MTITRDPMPRQRIPRCCPEHRQHIIGVIGWLLAVDAHAVVVDMIERGWEPTAAATSYRRWMFGEFGASIGAGLALAVSTATPDGCPHCDAPTVGRWCPHCGVEW